MSERVIHSPAQRRMHDSMNDSAYEKAVHVEERLNGHEDLCGERFRNLHGDIAEMRTAFAGLSQRQESYHKENREDIAKVGAAVTKLTTAIDVTRGRATGAHLLGMAIKDWIVVLIAFGAVLYSVVTGHPVAGQP